jgi:hypothetical protein
LIDAANLIGEDPDVVKSDAYQNMRAGAALLRKFYDETPKPADATGDEIESWRNAIVKYCGIPQPELSESHALHVYEFINTGYHDYGIEWDAHPVNLGPMRADVARIRTEVRNHVEVKTAGAEAPDATAVTLPLQPTVQTQAAPAPAQESARAGADENIRQRWYLTGLIAVLLGIGLVYRLKRRGQTA